MQDKTFRLAAALSIGLAMPAHAAQTAQTAVPCITDAEIHGMISYVAPSLLNRVDQECRGSVAEDGYLARQLPSLASSLEGGKDDAWPMAKAAFLKFGEMGKKKSIDLSGLPDDFLRPVIDAAVTSEFDLKLTPDRCADIEAVMEPLAPLSSRALVDLITVAVSIAARKDDKMRSCPKQR